MFLKILSVSLLALSMSTGAFAQSNTGSKGGTNAAGGKDSSSSAAASTQGTRSGSNDPGNKAGDASGQATANSNATSPNSHGKSQDCNGMTTTKNTTHKKHQANKTASVDCR